MPDSVKKRTVRRQSQRISFHFFKIALHRNPMTVICFFSLCPRIRLQVLESFGALPFSRHSPVPEHILPCTDEVRNLYHCSCLIFTITLPSSLVNRLARYAAEIPLIRSANHATAAASQSSPWQSVFLAKMTVRCPAVWRGHLCHLVDIRPELLAPACPGQIQLHSAA